MTYDFYSCVEYRARQSMIAKQNWRDGKYLSLIRPLQTRYCKNIDCKKTFKVKVFDQKKYCSISCATHVNNFGRKLSEITRKKISVSISRLPKSLYENKVLPKVSLTCFACHKSFKVTPYLVKIRKYCSNECAITTIGRMTTSPKASKGKPGIRQDISPNICFYSTWEANVARVFDLVNLRWQYAPKIFDLGQHTYRPDFYLPDFDMFIEVKNFMWKYSLERDRLFRKLYPKVKLDLIQRDDYLLIKSNYKDFIENWE